MSADPSGACLALLLDAPMQSWGHASRFERRTTALHPTRSGILGLVAAALGIDKYSTGEDERLARYACLRISTCSLPRRSKHHGKSELPILRLEDYHTVTGIRRASGKTAEDATVQTYRHYLLDARFGVLIEGPSPLLDELASALRNPQWGLWFGRKSCLPATPLVAADPAPISLVWPRLLQRAGYSGNEPREWFDQVVESTVDDAQAERIEDCPLGFGRAIGERHAPRWIRFVPRQRPRGD